MSYKLFIDDERFPPDDNSHWEIVRTSCEAIDYVKEHGIPSFISFDHDLGGDDTSMKFINWLIEAYLDGEVKIDSPFKYVVHSQNPIGVKNIEGKLNSFFKHITPKTETVHITFKEFLTEKKRNYTKEYIVQRLFKDWQNDPIMPIDDKYVEDLRGIDKEVFWKSVAEIEEFLKKSKLPLDDAWQAYYEDLTKRAEKVLYKHLH